MLDWKRITGIIYIIIYIIAFGPLFRKLREYAVCSLAHVDVFWVEFADSLA